MGMNFDSFAKRLANNQTRRSVLKRLTGGVVGGAVATALAGQLSPANAQAATCPTDPFPVFFTPTKASDGTWTLSHINLAGVILHGARRDERSGEFSIAGATIASGYIINRVLPSSPPLNPGTPVDPLPTNPRPGSINDTKLDPLPTHPRPGSVNDTKLDPLPIGQPKPGSVNDTKLDPMPTIPGPTLVNDTKLNPLPIDPNKPPVVVSPIGAVPAPTSINDTKLIPMPMTPQR